MSEGSVEAKFLKSLNVLYVEDDDEVRPLLARFLQRWVKEVHIAINGQEGFEAYQKFRPDVIITDIKMPVMDGLEMAKAIKSQHREVPIIVITAYSERDYFIRSIEVGVDQYVTKPVDTDALLEAIYRGTLSHYQKREMDRIQHKLIEALDQTVIVLSRAIEMRDPYTDGHQKRVSQLAVAIAREMGLSDDQINGVRLGSLIHDVGKIYIPAEILSSPRKLQEVESNIIKTHPTVGRDILHSANFPWPLERMVGEHQERLDGSGYPTGLKGDEILLEARIIAVADVVEAMTSYRPYRPSVGMEAALAEIRENRGRLYDPAVVDAFLAVMERHGNRFWEALP